ncbi:oligosaccharide flippase family protein [Marinilabilia rubra]|uniref:Polysaccharide biosynthesis protein n=1 Tax=Marinilabilia rubra TaxID=2162893 RepID=A0A2U2BBC0_9BACT|nr:oligosaccharide flippase family protein [Marinilabilia rubra]PWE00358.1 polysaccharide biosynthesis protein [Marinilabilia rubra]
MGERKAFIKDTFVYGLGNGLKKFIGLFLLPFYTRALTVGEFGMLETLGTAAALLGGFLSVGLDSACGYYYFKASDRQKADVLSTTFYLRLLSFLIIVPLLFFQKPLARLVFGDSDQSFLIVLLLLLVPVNLMMSEQSHLFRYFRQPWRYNIITVVKSLANIGIGITLVIVLKQGVQGAMWARIGSSLLVVVLAFGVFNFRKYSFRFSLGWARQLLKYGFPLIWAGIAAWIYNSSDRFFLLHYHDLREVGLYSIGAVFSQPVLLINMAVQMSFSVLFFKLYHKEENPNKPATRKMAVDIYSLYLSGSVILATTLSVFSDVLIPVVATPDYAGGARVVPMLVFSYIAAQSFQTMGPGISLSEKTWHFAWITGFTAILNIGLNFLLVPRMGFIGAGIATLISFVIYWIVKVYVASKYFPIKYPFFSILMFYVFGVGVSLLITTFEFHASGWMKFLAILLVTSCAFLFKLLKWEDVRMVWSKISRRET